MTGPRDAVGLVFGGQGCDPVPAARRLDRAVLEPLGEIVGADLARWLRTGDPRLQATEVRQPLQVAVQLDLARHLPAAAAVAGHSLGAVAARAHATATPVLDGARLARARGEAMARAARARPGELLAFGDEGRAKRLLARRRGETALAAHNGPGEWVVAALAEAVPEALACGGRRLHAGGPWHGPWFRDLAGTIGGLAALDRRRAPIPVLGPRLAESLHRPVDWPRTLRDLATRVGSVVTVGPGARIQRKLIRAVLPEMPVRAVERWPADEARAS